MDDCPCRCWMGAVGEGEHVTQMVKSALDLGYRHIDTVWYLILLHFREAYVYWCRLRTTVSLRSFVQELPPYNDTAEPGDEQSVGEALHESSVPRSEIFLTTKLEYGDVPSRRLKLRYSPVISQNDHGGVKEALNESLRKLRVDYVDLYLMHWPMGVRRVR